jgi:hypothetical protein
MSAHLAESTKADQFPSELKRHGRAAKEIQADSIAKDASSHHPQRLPDKPAENKKKPTRAKKRRQGCSSRSCIVILETVATSYRRLLPPPKIIRLRKPYVRRSLDRRRFLMDTASVTGFMRVKQTKGDHQSTVANPASRTS